MYTFIYPCTPSFIPCYILIHFFPSFFPLPPPCCSFLSEYHHLWLSNPLSTTTTTSSTKTTTTQQALYPLPLLLPPQIPLPIPIPPLLLLSTLVREIFKPSDQGLALVLMLAGALALVLVRNEDSFSLPPVPEAEVGLRLMVVC